MQRAIRSLVEFSRALSSTEDAQTILELLARAATTQLAAVASVLFVVRENGQVELAASEGLPAPVAVTVEPDALIPDLAREVARAGGWPERDVRVLPIASDGDLFGALVLVQHAEVALEPWRIEVAEGMIALAGAALAKAHQAEQRRRADVELKASREALLRHEKLQLLGQMATGIAHDLRNLFSPISLQLTLLRRDPSRIEKTIDVLERVVKRGLDTVERMRTFARHSSNRKRERAALDSLVEEAAELCAPRLHQVGTVRLELELGDPPPVLLEASELVSAVVNLVANAIDAMPGGGAIQLRTGSAGGRAFVQVRDDGPGIPPEIQTRVFEPFFTTKGEAGTGLGLASVLAFVERQDGTVTLDSRAGAGTTFTLSFPPVPAESDQRAPETESASRTI